MGEVKNAFRCSNPKCKKVLGVVDLQAGSVEIKCKCGTVNTISVQPKPTGEQKYIHNAPYQNRMDLVKKG